MKMKLTDGNDNLIVNEAGILFVYSIRRTVKRFNENVSFKTLCSVKRTFWFKS